LVQCENSLGREQCEGELHYDKDSKMHKCSVCGYLYDREWYQRLVEAEIDSINAERESLAFDMNRSLTKEKRALDAL
jgi:hypothetical protein